MITYGDSIYKEREIPLKTLNNFLNKYLYGSISCVHILPFFPFSSDDGFSVIDFYKVNSNLGEWNHILEIGNRFDLMFDLVINHVSQKSEWFQNFLQDKKPGRNYFITPDENADLKSVTRPRSSPLLSEYQTINGLKKVWTTFSADQVDLNFSNPEVLIEMIRVFLFYLSKGVKIIRLDAIAFLWKKEGTTCLHLPETHEMVKLLRDIASTVNPSVILLTETNVPHVENVSYFGNGDEAHMVYQFGLPPLLLHALHTGNAVYLTEWAGSIPVLKPGNTFFNFTASHDGIGVRPLEGILPDDEREILLKNMQKAGGAISYKSNSDHSKSPYEINITYFDALKMNVNGEQKFQNERFICSQTIMMGMKGVPAFYIHSLLATQNDYEGVKTTGMNRSINRKKLLFDDLIAQIENEPDKKYLFNELIRIIGIRKSQKAFHPDAPMKVMNLGASFFCFIRSFSNEMLISLSNVTQHDQWIINLNTLIGISNSTGFDILSGSEKPFNELQLNPYQTVWLLIK
ncbi:MAG: sugar phosphorylase [Bacteroidales bacterium]|nr:sugar phosphorylase [Bacteroidales bacterium]